MKTVRHSLYFQTLSMLLCYLSVIGLALFLSFKMQFGFGWDAVLHSPIGDRVDAINEAILANLRATNSDKWNGVLSEFAEKYGVSFYLVDISGKQLAGKQVDLPDAVKDRVTHLIPPFPFIGHDGHAAGPNFLFRQAEPPLGMPNDFAPFQAPHQMATHGSFRFVTVNDDFHHAPMHHPKFFVQADHQSYICTRLPPLGRAQGFPLPTILIASSPNLWQSRLLFDFGLLACVTGAVVVFSLLFWWPFAYSISRRISTLTSATEKIADGRFDVRVNQSNKDELGRLAHAVNLMAERLDQYVRSQKRMLGDISHELVTPLARLDMAVELLGNSSNATRSDLIGDIRDEVTEMHHLVQELLAFSKAGLKGKQTDLDCVSVQSVIADVIARIAPGKPISVDVADNLEVLADPVLLSRSISNILRNSLRYASGSEISVTAVSAQDLVSIVITDNGPGVPEEAIASLGEPFFRPEFSRSRELGGTGLGLAIVKTCIETCSGQVYLSNRPEGGLKVELRMQKANLNQSQPQVLATSGSKSG